MEPLDPQPSSRRLIVTADDFGAAAWIDEGIFAGVAAGNVTTVGVLANYPRAVEAVRLLRARSSHVGVGVHLNITGGSPLTASAALGRLCDKTGSFPGLAGVLSVLTRLDIVAIESELRAQIELVRNSCADLDHFSSHHNILANFPPFQDLMIRLASDYDVPIRMPIAVSQTHSRRFGYARTRRRAWRSVFRLVVSDPVRALPILPGTFKRMIGTKRILDERGIRHPDHMVDALYGIPTEKNLRHILTHLPPGISELVVHLADEIAGYLIPAGLETDIALQRLVERNLLVGDTLRRIMDSKGIVPGSYAAIPRPVGYTS